MISRGVCSRSRDRSRRRSTTSSSGWRVSPSAIPIRLPVPVPLASMALRAANALGADLPVDGGQLTMLGEGNVVTSPSGNALTTVFGSARDEAG